MNDRKLHPLEIGAAVAAGIFVVGAFLPMRVTEYPIMTITADLLDSGGGIVAVLAALAAVVLVVRRLRIAAIVALAAAGSIALWRVIDLGAIEGSTLGYGAYVMAAGFVGGLALLAVRLIRVRLAAQPSEAWEPQETRGYDPSPAGLRETDPEDSLVNVE
jgi:hypothetical protein